MEEFIPFDKAMCITKDMITAITIIKIRNSSEGKYINACYLILKYTGKQNMIH